MERSDLRQSAGAARDPDPPFVPRRPQSNSVDKVPVSRSTGTDGRVIRPSAAAWRSRQLRTEGSDLQPFLANRRSLREVLRRSFVDDLAMSHDVEPLADLSERSSAFAPPAGSRRRARDLHEKLADVLNHLRRQPLGRLVDHDEVPVAHQRPAHRQHLLFAARKHARPARRAPISRVAGTYRNMSLSDPCSAQPPLCPGPFCLDRSRRAK